MERLREIQKERRELFEKSKVKPKPAQYRNKCSGRLEIVPCSNYGGYNANINNYPQEKRNKEYLRTKLLWKHPQI